MSYKQATVYDEVRARAGASASGRRWVAPPFAAITTTVGIGRRFRSPIAWSTLDRHGNPNVPKPLRQFRRLEHHRAGRLLGPTFGPNEVLSQINHKQANLVLCHNPDVVDHPIWNGYRGWILAGHTHGGQVKPPFLPPPILPVTKQTLLRRRISICGTAAGCTSIADWGTRCPCASMCGRKSRCSG